MKSWIIFTGITIIYFTICPLVTGQEERCPSENCMLPYQCEYSSTLRGCGSSKICCSVVKSEYRTMCRHHGGECSSNFCAEALIRDVVDCPAGSRCCVLV